MTPLARPRRRRPRGGVAPLFRTTTVPPRSAPRSTSTEDAARMRVDRALEKLRAVCSPGAASRRPAPCSRPRWPTRRWSPRGGPRRHDHQCGAGHRRRIFYEHYYDYLSAVARHCDWLHCLPNESSPPRRGRPWPWTAGERDRARTQIRELQQRAAEVDGQLTVAEQTKTSRFSATGKRSLSQGCRNPAMNQLEGRSVLSRIPVPSDPAEARRQIREYNIENRDTRIAPFIASSGFTPAQCEQFKSS